MKQNGEPELIMGALMEIWYIFEVASLINGIDSRNYLGIMYISYRETINLDPNAKQSRTHNAPNPPKKHLRMSKRYCKRCLSSTVIKERNNKKNKIISHESDWKNLKGLIMLS